MMKLEVYDQLPHRSDLSTLLYKYFDEMEGGCYGSTTDALEDMISSNRHIYVLYRDKEMIGFIVMYINNQFNLAKPVAVNEYMYLLPNHRSKIATKYMLLQLLDYCNNLQVDLIGVTYNTSSNIANSRFINSEPIATVLRTPLEEITTKLNKLTRKKNV